MVDLGHPLVTEVINQELDNVSICNNSLDSGPMDFNNEVFTDKRHGLENKKRWAKECEVVWTGLINN